MRFEIKDNNGLTIWVTFDKEKILRHIAAYQTLELARYPQLTKRASFDPSYVADPSVYADTVKEFAHTVDQISAADLKAMFNLMISRKVNKKLAKNRVHGSWSCCPAVYTSPKYRFWQGLEVYVKTTSDHTAELLFRAKTVDRRN